MTYQQDKTKVFNWVMVTAASFVIGLLWSIDTKLNTLITENAVKLSR
ncbi:MAG: hypothetical protein WC760_02975 [Bacteroidia bacterium]